MIPVSFSPTSNEIKQFSEKCPDMSFNFKEVEYTYNSFNVNEILSTVLPENLPAVTNFAQIGHICHLNLRKVHEPYEELIGEVILDKVNNCRTVVVKEKAIENEFRTLPLKIIAGEKTATSLICEHKEHGCVFAMNFETVYWNSRLQEEHHNVSQFIIDRCQNRENGKRIHVIDACCGIGPFVIPIAKAKKKVVKNQNIGSIFANDLNPESMKWMIKNTWLNKVDGYVEFNTENGEIKPMDGVDFIKDCFLKTDESTNEKILSLDSEVIILMNLPRFSVSELMPRMVGMFADSTDNSTENIGNPESIKIIAHHMSPEKGDTLIDKKADPEGVFEQVQGELPEGFKLEQFWNVRQLVGEKYLRILVDVESSVLFGKKINSGEPVEKKAKLSENESK